MKKIKEPNLKVIKFEKMDVIATSDVKSVGGVMMTVKYSDVSSGWGFVNND